MWHKRYRLDQSVTGPKSARNVHRLCSYVHRRYTDGDLSHRQISVVDEEFAVSRDGIEMFGLDFAAGIEGCRFAVGVRNANNKISVGMHCRRSWRWTRATIESKNRTSTEYSGGAIKSGGRRSILKPKCHVKLPFTRSRARRAPIHSEVRLVAVTVAGVVWSLLRTFFRGSILSVLSRLL